MNASNQTELSGGGGSAHSTPLAIFDDVEHIIITLSGLAAGVFFNLWMFLLVQMPAEPPQPPRRRVLVKETSHCLIFLNVSVAFRLLLTSSSLSLFFLLSSKSFAAASSPFLLETPLAEGGEPDFVRLELDFVHIAANRPQRCFHMHKSVLLSRHDCGQRIYRDFANKKEHRDAYQDGQPQKKTVSYLYVFKWSCLVHL